VVSKKDLTDYRDIKEKDTIIQIERKKVKFEVIEDNKISKSNPIRSKSVTQLQNNTNKNIVKEIKSEKLSNNIYNVSNV